MPILLYDEMKGDSEKSMHSHDLYDEMKGDSEKFSEQLHDRCRTYIVEIVHQF
jgi:hypothetical protein